MQLRSRRRGGGGGGGGNENRGGLTEVPGSVVDGASAGAKKKSAKDGDDAGKKGDDGWTEEQEAEEGLNVLAAPSSSSWTAGAIAGPIGLLLVMVLVAATLALAARQLIPLLMPDQAVYRSPFMERANTFDRK